MFKIIKMRKYDNSKCCRMFCPGDIHAWAVRSDDVDEFLAAYSDGEPEIIDVPNDAVIYAADFYDVDDWVMTPIYDPECLDDEMNPEPELVPFDPEKHCIRKTYSRIDEFDDFSPVFFNDYQLIIKERDSE